MLMLPGCIFLLLVIVAPIISTFGMSLTSYNFMKPQAKTWVGFKNYVDIFKDPFFRLPCSRSSMQPSGMETVLPPKSIVPLTTYL